MPRLILASAIIALAFTAIPPNHVQALWSGENDHGYAYLGASFRTISAGTLNYDAPEIFGEDNPADAVSETILRLTLEAELGDWFAHQFHLVQDARFMTETATSAGGSMVAAATDAMLYRAVDARRDWTDDVDAKSSLAVDRCNVTFRMPRVDLTIGRQAVNFSQAYFWNPLDVFLAFDPETFDRDYKPGVDAVRCDIALGNFSGISLVTAFGRELTLAQRGGEMAIESLPFSEEAETGMAAMARLKTNVRNWDIAIQGGKVYGGYQAGLGFSGEIIRWGVRGESAWFSADGEQKVLIDGGESARIELETELLEDAFTGVIGADYRFDSSLHINVEYLYNGAADPDDLTTGLIRSFFGASLSANRHLIGVQSTYELHPLLNGQLAVVYAPNDQSAMIAPNLVYSIADEADFLVGAILGYGERPRVNELGQIELISEYGTYPHTIYAEIKFYF